MRIRNVDTGKLWNFNEIATDNRVLDILEESYDDAMDIPTTIGIRHIVIGKDSEWYRNNSGYFYMET